MVTVERTQPRHGPPTRLAQAVADWLEHQCNHFGDAPLSRAEVLHGVADYHTGAMVGLRLRDKHQANRWRCVPRSVFSNEQAAEIVHELWRRGAR